MDACGEESGVRSCWVEDGHRMCSGGDGAAADAADSRALVAREHLQGVSS